MKKDKRKLYDSDKIDNFRQLVDRYKTLYSDKTAFEFKEEPHSKEHITISYKQFANDIEALGTALLNLDLRSKRVGIIAPNRYEWCVSYLAVTTSDIVVVPLDKSLPNNEIEDLVKRSKIDAIIFDKKYSEIFTKIQKENSSNLKHFICMDDETGFDSYTHLLEQGKSLITNGDTSYKNIEIDNKKMAIMLFTSGTTSISKAVALSQSNICEDIYALSQMTDIRK